jgi:hypothetical protein
MPDRIRIGVEFEFAADDVEGLPAFRDTLWFDSIAEYQSVQHELDELKQERYDNWKQVVKNPPVVEPVVVDRLQAAYDALDAADVATSVARDVLDSLEPTPDEG